MIVYIPYPVIYCSMLAKLWQPCCTTSSLPPSPGHCVKLSLFTSFWWECLEQMTRSGSTSIWHWDGVCKQSSSHIIIVMNNAICWNDYLCLQPNNDAFAWLLPTTCSPPHSHCGDISCLWTQVLSHQTLFWWGKPTLQPSQGVSVTAYISSLVSIHCTIWLFCSQLLAAQSEWNDICFCWTNDFNHCGEKYIIAYVRMYTGNYNSYYACTCVPNTFLSLTSTSARMHV